MAEGAHRHGIGLGVVLSGDAALVHAYIASPLIDWLALPELLFIRLIQMIMIPLAVFGLMCQVTALVGWNAVSGLGMYVFAVLLAVANVVVAWWCGLRPAKFLAG